MKDTKKYKESRQLPKGGYLHNDRVEPESSAEAPSISSMSENKGNNVNEYKERLLEKILEPANLNLAYKKVKAKKGSSGVDGMTVDDLLNFLKQNGQKLRQSILQGTHKPSPVQRVEIPKPDGKSRMLGIPTVLDRVIQQAIAQILSPLFEEKFSEHSYGFRPGRSAKQAVEKCREYIEAGYTWTVDIDLADYFDTVNHDRLIRRLSQTVKDARVISLVRKYLVSGVMIGGVVTETQKGTPQGGNLSPLLAILYLMNLKLNLRKGDSAL